jgi:hypothetical protein
MANDLTTMRTIRTKQVEIRKSLNHREEANKAIREKITHIWTAEKEKRTEEFNKLTKALIEGREKVRGYQKDLRELKMEIKSVNRHYDLSKS